MSQSKLKILEPNWVAVDSHGLSVVDDYIQNFSNDFESLAYALDAIKTNDYASKGVIVAVKATMFANSEKAAELSAGVMEQMILMPELGANPYE